MLVPEGILDPRPFEGVPLDRKMVFRLSRHHPEDVLKGVWWEPIGRHEDIFRHDAGKPCVIPVDEGDACFQSDHILSPSMSMKVGTIVSIATMAATAVNMKKATYLSMGEMVASLFAYSSL